GFLRHGDVLPALVEGLRVLEYRGYDSVGVGIVRDGEILVRRRAGRIEELERILGKGELAGAQLGIGHSRWATHGPPTDPNAHPHGDAAGRIALVHNGIIENHQVLKQELARDGVQFRSQTDTEVLAQLVGREFAREGDLAAAVRRALQRVRGYYAIAAVSAG